MRTIRRFLVLVALMFWLGGFTFYASVVVPISTRILGSPLRQGFITREVAFYLNLAAVVGLVLLGWDVLATRDPLAPRSRGRAGLWLFMVLAQALLFYLYAHLDSMMQAKGRIILDHEAFRPAHRLYLWTHTFQWAAGAIFIFLMLSAWQKEDSRGQPSPGTLEDAARSTILLSSLCLGVCLVPFLAR